MIRIFLDTIVPIFAIIALGAGLRQRRLLNETTSRAINQIVYYVAIPAMLLSKLTHMSFTTSFRPLMVACVCATVLTLWLIVFAGARMAIGERSQRATFIQSSIHGNLGYMGFALAFYALNETGFAQAVVLGGFLMIVQNILAVLSFVLQDQDRPMHHAWWVLVRPILKNPVILSVLAGMTLSLTRITLPKPVSRILAILSGMAFPLALLLIGATLSFSPVRRLSKELIAIGATKLVILPLLGSLLMFACGIAAPAQLPGLILLASPPATITYVFATEMNGDPQLAATSVSMHTLLCAATFSLLFYLVTPPV